MTLFKFFKKKEKEKIKIISNSLRIVTKSSGTHQFSVRPWNGTSYITPWLKFYKWNFGKTSENFILKHTDGEDLFKKDEIAYFNIRINTEYIEA